VEPVRIIPCLDMKDGRVVKGVHFVKLRDAGDPVENAAYYREAGADEVAMLDIAATVEGRKTRIEWARAVAEVLGGVPLTVGGGINELADVEALVEVGVSKVSMNSAAVARPELVREVADAYGSSRVIVAIDGRRNAGMASGFEVVVSGGHKPTGMDCVEWARRCEELGAGTLLPTSMDGDGTLAGYDIPFTRAIAEAVSLPVIASGGAGTLEHFYEAVVEGKAQRSSRHRSSTSAPSVSARSRRTLPAGGFPSGHSIPRPPGWPRRSETPLAESDLAGFDEPEDPVVLAGMLCDLKTDVRTRVGVPHLVVVDLHRGDVLLEVARVSHDVDMVPDVERSGEVYARDTEVRPVVGHDPDLLFTYRLRGHC
jgi:imidazole glycerol-phosphate synthase subunit HisF